LFVYLILFPWGREKKRMALRDIRQYPDKVLRERSEDLDLSSDLACQIRDDLIDTLSLVSGAGLAAPQIGFSYNAVIIRPSIMKIHNPDPSEKNPDFWFLGNPVITVLSDSEKIVWKEACLSVPVVSGPVARESYIKINYENIKGEKKEVTLGPPMSMVMQHEVDHLEGKLYIDRVQGVSKYMINKKLKKAFRKEKKNHEQLVETMASISRPQLTKLHNEKRKSLREKRKNKKKSRSKG